MLDRGNHHLKFGGYLFRLEFNPVIPTNARGNFTFNGQWTGNAFADFMLGYPSVVPGRHRTRRRAWPEHVVPRLRAGRLEDQIEPDLQLRAAVRDQQRDDRRRQSARRGRPARQTIRHCERREREPVADCRPAVVADSYSLRDVGGSRVEARPAAAQLPALRPAIGCRVGGRRRRQDRRQRRFRRVPQPVGVQRPAGARLDAAVLLCENGHGGWPTPIQPTQQISTVLLAPANGTVGGNTMDWDFRTEYAKNYSVSVQRQVTPTTMVEVSFLRSAIVGADSSTVRNVPEPGPGAIGPRRPVPQLANITAIRWDGYSIFNGVTFRVEQRLSRGLASTASYSLVEGDRRCLGSRGNGLRSQPAAGCAQHGR